MIKLYTFGPCFDVMDASPFVVKVDLFLRMANLPYETDADFNHLKISPKGKLPFIEDNDVKIGDSEVIIEYLTQTYGIQLDSFLTAEQKAFAHLTTKSLDENLYWCLVYSRWMRDDTWPIVNETFFGTLPFLFRLFVPNMIRKGVKKNLHGQGIGRHSNEEILEIADKSFTALSTLLADKDYLFGDQVCSFDAAVYSMLCQFISVNFYNEFNALARKYQNLIKYCERIENKFY
ncbi:MAG: glutathione S-transferase family protein [Alteromonadaceae bacterium]|nr:glutathione S-transferase family protein [Alteromonadaceae bacterium]